jgi:putative spermidine/putrescine transport system substrate-binding protein
LFENPICSRLYNLGRKQAREPENTYIHVKVLSLGDSPVARIDAKAALTATMRTLTVAAMALLVASCDDGKRDKGETTLSLASWGSQLQADLMKELVTPAAAKVGVKVRDESWDGDYPSLTTRIDRGINAWDLVHVDGIYVLTPRWKSLFYQDPTRQQGELSGALIQNTDLREPLKMGFAVPILEYGYLIAGRQAQFPGAPINSMTWADFWDTKSYPGDRGMRDTPEGNIEAALGSLNIKPRELYDEQNPARKRELVALAIEQLEKLKPNIIWWKTGEALQQGLESGDMALAAAWSGRVRSSFTAVCGPQGKIATCDVQISPGSSLISTDWWVIPKNAPNKEAASQVLEQMMSKEAAPGAARFSQSQGYAVPLRGAEPEDPIAKYFIMAGSSDNPAIYGRISEKFWGENLDWIRTEWAKFRARQ